MIDINHYFKKIKAIICIKCFNTLTLYENRPFGEMVSRNNGNVALPGQYRQGAPEKDKMNTPCPNCKFEKNIYLYKYKNFTSDKLDVRCTSLQYQKPNLIKCEKCHLIFSELINQKFESFYEEVEDKLYIDQILFKKKYFQNTLKKIKKYLSIDKEVLEIGSYYGIFGSLIKPHVKKYKGLELSKHAVNYARENYYLDCENNTINEYLKHDIKLDIILMSHVIEHLDDPFKNINTIQEKMDKSSILIFSTYNMDSFIAKLLGKNYHWIMPMHKYYFSKKVLKNILFRYNLEIIETITDTHIISLKYFFIKIKAIFPFLSFLLNPLIKINLLSNVNIKINLGDLDIYIVRKT
jgi:2-polyprenyl-3-methyl-5-hydroxy-6-metoxy-1,4-benzoquinol methylase